MTRGERNANPGNIRIVPGVSWQGQAQSQTDDAFVRFTDPVWGIRAIVRILRSYERAGIDTLQGAIDRWAPPTENNSAAYVEDVCQHCGIEANDKVSLESIMDELVKAIIWHENGEMPYTDAQINTGIALA